MKKAKRSYSSGEVPDVGPKGKGKGKGQSDRAPFLRPSNIPAKGATVTFTGQSRVVRGSFGDQWVCGVKVGGAEYDWGIRVGGSVHRALKALTGKKLKAGLKVNVERREFENDRGEDISFIAIVED